MNDDEDDIIDRDEEKPEEIPNGTAKECELSLQAQVTAMKETVSSLQESNKKKDITIITMQARVDTADENCTEAQKAYESTKSKLVESVEHYRLASEQAQMFRN